MKKMVSRNLISQLGFLISGSHFASKNEFSIKSKTRQNQFQNSRAAKDVNFTFKIMKPFFWKCLFQKIGLNTPFRVVVNISIHTVWFIRDGL